MVRVEEKARTLVRECCLEEIDFPFPATSGSALKALEGGTVGRIGYLSLRRSWMSASPIGGWVKGACDDVRCRSENFGVCWTF